MSRASNRSHRTAWFVLLMPMLLAGGCSSLREALDAENVEYRNARQGPMLDVPPDLVSPRGDGRYAVPQRGGSQPSLVEFNRQRQGLARTGTGAGLQRTGNTLPEAAGARIHRAGQVRWVKVDAEPDAVWPILLDFWAVQGFNLEMASPQLGIMETDWAERYQRVENSGLRGILASKTGAVYATGERDKYRTRIERAPDGGTEIYLTYWGREEIVTGIHKDRSTWQANNDNRPVLEVEYLRRILARFDGALSAGEARPAATPAGGAADSAASGMASMGAEITASSRARLDKREDGNGQLLLAEPFEQAWREIGLILDRQDFTIADRNRAQGIYSIRYVDPERRDQQQGVLSRIFSGERKDLSDQHYQLHIADEGRQSRISVRLADGMAPSSEEDRRVADSILRVLQENIH